MKRLLFYLLALLTVPLIPSTALTYPLRIWVMHNELPNPDTVVTEERVKQAIDNWRKDENIIIENGVQNLTAPRETDDGFPFASYIINGNQMLNELRLFIQAEGGDQPVAVEFIRWNDAYNRLEAALSSKDISSVPDVVQVGSSWIASFADQDLLMDLSDHIDSTQFFPPSIASATLPDQEGLFAAPWFVDVRLLYYNKQYIKSPDEVSDWDSFLKTCQTLKKSGGEHLIGFQNTVSWNLLHDLAPWLWAGGGGIIDIDSPGSLSGIYYLNKLSTNGCAVFNARSQESAEDLFIKGDYATIITGPWLIKRLGDHWQDKYGITLPPAGPQGSVPFVGGSHLAVSKTSRSRGNLKRAIDLVNFLTSADSQARFAFNTGLPSPHRAVTDQFPDEQLSGVFRRALTQGRSYPSMPAWGKIVENEMIRNHIWHLWRNISYGASDATLAGTAHSAATDLRSRLLMVQMRRHIMSFATVALMLGLLGGAMIIRWRRRFVTAANQIESKVAELSRINAEHAMLEGKILVLERKEQSQFIKSNSLTRELESLRQQTISLRSELDSMHKQHAQAQSKKIGSFVMHSDGSLIVDNFEIHFENNRQARRLIEHMTRQASVGLSSTHCLWGYVLFGWDPHLIQSSPLKLFEIMVSKINSQLKKTGKPPLMRRTGRKTGAWRLIWDINSEQHSDIHAALKKAKAAADHFNRGSCDQAKSLALDAVKLDPKNIKALSLLRSLQHDEKDPLWKISERLLGHCLAELQRGIAYVGEILTWDKLPNGINDETAHEVLRLMKHQMEYLDRNYKYLFAEGRFIKSTLVNDITNQMLAIKNEIVSLRTTGVSEDHVWASVVGGENFERLISYPSIRSLVNNFYNYETRSCENPHLTQLALVLMLSKPESLHSIDGIRSEEELVKMINRGLQTQFKELEHHLLSLPMM